MLSGLARSLAAATVASFSLLALCGCILSPSSAGSPPGAQEVSEELAPVPVRIPDGVVATGELVGADGTDFGQLRIESQSGSFTLYLPETGLEHREGLIGAFSDSPFTIDECGDANIWQVGLGYDSQAYAPVQSLEFFPPEFSDPSFFTAFLLVQSGAVQANGCWQPILAVAPLEWDVPDTHPWIEAVDSGQAAAANGVVSEVDGQFLYKTAAGDVWSEIAARFGLTAEDLVWLNPIRTPGAPGMAYADQVLNLEPKNRGNSESRRPQ